MPRFYHLPPAWPGRLAELPLLVAPDVTGPGAVRFCHATARSEFRPRLLGRSAVQRKRHRDIESGKRGHPAGSGLPTPHQPPDGPLGGWHGNGAPRLATVLG